MEQDIQALARALRLRVPLDAAALLEKEDKVTIAQALELLPAKLARRIVEHLPPDLRPYDPATLTGEHSAPGTVAELLDPSPGAVRPDTSVRDAVDFLSHAETPTDITYLYVTDADDRLVGLVVMRDLLLAQPDDRVERIMVPRPFAFRADESLSEAGKAAVRRHYPVYPVVDGEGRLMGQVRGWRLFERQVIEISAQSGQMVGVTKEERVDTPVLGAFVKRNPWLMLNLVTAFFAAFVVGSFATTIEKIVALAAFLPVLAGQSGNTGCQALAITLRGMFLGDVDKSSKFALLRKEAMLGVLNGLAAGLVAGGAMWFYALQSPESAAQAPVLALVIIIAMTGACLASGMSGVLIPLLLRRLGADPATASAIFLTTVTDVVGMGLMLMLASTLVL